VRWAEYFAGRGHEVHLISTEPYENERAENVNLHLLRVFRPRVRIVSSMINLLLYTVQIRRLLKRVQPHILHAHYISDYAFLGALSGFHPLVLTAWGSDILITPKESGRVRAEVKFALRRADLITCGGEHVRRSLIELGAELERISLVYWGIDTQKFHPRQRSAKIQEELGISNSPAVISLSSLEPSYDIESLIASVPLVLKEIPEAKFVIVGRGSQEMKLKELARSLGVSASLRFVGWIPHDRVPEYIACGDVSVSTFLSSGGLSQGTAEAMACGLPVILTDFGDNRNWVQDGVNGYVIPLRSPEVLASKIIHLIHNKDVREKFGQINKQIIQERDNWQKEMEKMEKLYTELIGGGRNENTHDWWSWVHGRSIV
jgi:glycosyltransferase involved in cell wall biosynthesis